jgi:hypothetical protein
VPVSKEKFFDIHLAIGGLVDGLPKEGFTPSSSEPTELKGRSFWCAKTKRSGTGWVAMYQPSSNMMVLGSK